MDGWMKNSWSSIVCLQLISGRRRALIRSRRRYIFLVSKILILPYKWNIMHLSCLLAWLRTNSACLVIFITYLSNNVWLYDIVASQQIMLIYLNHTHVLISFLFTPQNGGGREGKKSRWPVRTTHGPVGGTKKSKAIRVWPPTTACIPVPNSWRRRHVKKKRGERMVVASTSRLSNGRLACTHNAAAACLASDSRKLGIRFQLSNPACWTGRL
jgi:hypothetical protein